MGKEPMTREEIALRLSDLVQRDDGCYEKECGELLKDKEAASILLQGKQNLVFVDAELLTGSGTVDLLICCQEIQLSGETRRKLIIWELKAPQCCLFKVENTLRACPTQELYSAENQLLHYHAQVRGSQFDRNKFDIISPEDVELGGIIIGRTDKYVYFDHRKNIPPDKAKCLATAAKEVRETNFYGKRLQLWTWDTVIQSLKMFTANNQSEIVQISTSESIGLGLEEGTKIIYKKQS